MGHLERYALILFILVGYAAVGMAAASIHNVSTAYKEYYVERSGLSRTLSQSSDYLFGQLIDPHRVDDRVFASGWGSKEEFGRWTDGREAKLVVARADPAYSGPVCITIQGEIATGGDRATAVSLQLDEGDPVRAEKEGEFVQLQAHVDAQDMLTLTWLIDQPINLKEMGLSDDARDLGFALRAVVIEDTPCRPNPLWFLGVKLNQT